MYAYIVHVHCTSTVYAFNHSLGAVMDENREELKEDDTPTETSGKKSLVYLAFMGAVFAVMVFFILRAVLT